MRLAHLSRYRRLCRLNPARLRLLPTSRIWSAPAQQAGRRSWKRAATITFAVRQVTIACGPIGGTHERRFA